MGVHVLVTYGTKHGATKEIAEKIGQVLQESGLTVDVQNARHVADLTPYNAVVLGSGVYIGAWCKEAAAFLQTNAEKLATLPVWIFSS
ncbi:MAG: flavodoxin domain-containing protein, partial [Anaerolineae bacterium]|nr:flavodoxin domain-containing protein [Anaerolineae bacterium]